MSKGRVPVNHTTSQPPPDIITTSNNPTNTSPDNGARVPLPRNSACLQCRRRRIKCDAAKPKCGACNRSYAWAVRTGAVPSPVLDCQYAADTETTAELGRSEGSMKRSRKESSDLASRPSGPEERDDEVMARILRTADNSRLQGYVSLLQRRLGNLQPSSWEGSTPGDSVWSTNQAATYFSIQSDFPLDDSISPPDVCVGQQIDFLDETAIFHQAFFPGWPRDLPNPAVMGNLVDAFFALVPVLPHIFNRSRFLLRMTLPPFHSDFPNIAILHAICAATGRYVGDVYNGPIDEDPIKPRLKMENPRMIPGFVTRHAALAKEAIDTNLAEVKNIYETAQALSIMMHHHHVEGLLLEGWLTTGSLARLLHPLGIMHESYSTDLRPAMGLLLPPPKDAIEKQERRNLLWCAVILDIRMESIGNWSGAICVDDIGVPLPSITESFDPQSSFVPDNQQTATSPDIWMRHDSTEAFCLYVKSMILLSKINLFTNKRRMWNDHATARISQEFMDLDAAIATFTMSCPLGMLDPLASERPKYVRTLNDDLLSTQLIIYVLSMKLHEPFAVYHDINNPHTRRVLNAAREVLRMIYRLSATSFDLRLVCHGEFVIFSAARVLVGFLRTELSTGSGGAGTKETLEAEIEVFTSLFSNRSLKFPIGLAVLRSMETLLRFARNPPQGRPRGPPPLGISGRPPGLPPMNLNSQSKMGRPEYVSEGPSASGSSLGDEGEVGTGRDVGAGRVRHTLVREVG